MHVGAALQITRAEIFDCTRELPEWPGELARENPGERPQHTARAKEHEHAQPRLVNDRRSEQREHEPGRQHAHEDRDAEPHEQLLLQAARPPAERVPSQPQPFHALEALEVQLEVIASVALHPESFTSTYPTPRTVRMRVCLRESS